MPPRSQGIIEVHSAVLLFGLAGLFGKFLPVPPHVIVFGRAFFASVALILFLRWFKARVFFGAKRDLPIFAALGSILAIHWITFFHSIQVSNVAVGLLTYSTFPVFVTFMEPYFFREKLRTFDVFAALLVLVGLFLVIPDFEFSNRITRGALWGMVSGFTFAVMSLVNRRVVQRYSSLVIALYQNAFAAGALLPFLWMSDWTLGARQILFLAFLGFFCTALAHALFIRSLLFITAQLASITSVLEPVYGIILAFLLLGEVPRVRTLLGGGIILGVVALSTGKRKSPRNSQGEKGCIICF